MKFPDLPRNFCCQRTTSHRSGMFPQVAAGIHMPSRAHDYGFFRTPGHLLVSPHKAAQSLRICDYGLARQAVISERQPKEVGARVSTIKGWPLGLLIPAAGGFLAFLYWTAASTYTLNGASVTASVANGYCHTAAGQLDQSLYPLSARVCASAAQVEGNKGTALTIAIVLMVIAGIMNRRRSAAVTR